MTRLPRPAVATTVLPTLVVLLEGTALAQSVPTPPPNPDPSQQTAVNPRPWRRREDRADRRHGREDVRYRPNRRTERTIVYENEVVMGVGLKVSLSPPEHVEDVKKDDETE